MNTYLLSRKSQEESAAIFLSKIEDSCLSIPSSTDYFPTSSLKEKITPSSLFPRKKIFSEETFEKLKEQILFFIFFFQRGSYEQFMASAELKARGWRFYKPIQSWLKGETDFENSMEESVEGIFSVFSLNSFSIAEKTMTLRLSELEID